MTTDAVTTNAVVVATTTACTVGTQRTEQTFSGKTLLNRELSWLDFANRLLDLAEDPNNALLERVKFIAIFSGGLDEFFQVRVAGLKDQVASGVRLLSPDGLSPSEQLRMIRDKVASLVARQSRIFLEDITPLLEEAKIRFLDVNMLDSEDKDYLIDVFNKQIFPVLTPLSVDPSHPFPYISNLSLNLAVVVKDPDTSEHRFARVKVPPLLPRFIMMPDKERFILLEQVIAAHLKRLFPYMDVGNHFVFRVTRNADLTLEEDEADDLVAAIEMELRRFRFSAAVRLEVDSAVTDEIKELLINDLGIDAEDVYTLDAPLDLSELWSIFSLDRPDLHAKPWVPMTPPPLANAGDEPVDFFKVLKTREVFIHHPYDSFATSVEAFIAQAAQDPDVLAIKQTLYRTSGDSSIVKSLIQAAEAGKQVAVLVEVKARFDEQANIAWAKVLEEAGVHVVYGIVGLKTHCKAVLVVRKEEDGLHHYSHIGTGNYNSKTARDYEDLGILSSDPNLGEDLVKLFNFLTGYSKQPNYDRIITAPFELKTKLLEMIENQAAKGRNGRIVIKINGLTDPAVIDSLYMAASAQVRIDLLVRGICLLRPGIKGLSENITVRSIVGRYLEHSRIYWFGDLDSPCDGVDRPQVLIGSADLMERNLDRRIELMVPVLETEHYMRIREILTLDMLDDTNTWILRPDDTWERVASPQGINAQERLAELARQRARRRREGEQS
ncbi:MAG: polyphosphate kinase 1 [Actinobacteria bacterium]|nr:polyphosphate kinase 1 [Actinomycetota bacterium]MCL6105669.1 polyphosphate kinase 1 [Actinomycetota bacterium]